jgi:hypothetical protein
LRTLCKINWHSWKLESGGYWILLNRCQRCDQPDNNLCQQLITIERALWESLNREVDPEWTEEDRQAVVLRELHNYSGYTEGGDEVAFYHDTYGYRFDWLKGGMFSQLLNVLSFRKSRPSMRAEVAARHLAENHPLAAAH